MADPPLSPADASSYRAPVYNAAAPVLSVAAPLTIGVVVCVLLSLIPSRHRRPFGAVLLGGAGAAYLSSSGGLGPLELAFTAAMTAVAFLGLRSNRWLGVGWLMHTAWDVVHAVRGSTILPFAPHASAGCAICDPVIALWYFADAPSLPELLAARRKRAHRTASFINLAIRSLIHIGTFYYTNIKDLYDNFNG